MIARRSPTIMMPAMLTAISILAMTISSLSHLLLLGLCIAGMPNSTPQGMRQIQLWMLLIAAVGLAMLAVGVILLRTGHPWWCTTLSLGVAVVMWIVLLEGTKP
jgi:hypothetical protein